MIARFLFATVARPSLQFAEAPKPSFQFGSLVRPRFAFTPGEVKPEFAWVPFDTVLYDLLKPDGLSGAGLITIAPTARLTARLQGAGAITTDVFGVLWASLRGSAGITVAPTASLSTKLGGSAPISVNPTGTMAAILQGQAPTSVNPTGALSAALYGLANISMSPAAILAANLSGSAAITVDATGKLASAYDASAEALFARMTTQPDDTRKGLYNDFIVGLKADGLWDLFDVLYWLAAGDTQQARLNFKSSLYTAAALNVPTFTPDRGYQGDGSSSYLDTGFADNTAGGNWSLSSAAISTYTNLFGSGGTLAGVNSSTSTRQSPQATSGGGRIHDSGSLTSSSSLTLPSAGMRTLNRTASSLIRIWMNGANVSGTGTSAAATAQTSGNHQILRGSSGTFGSHRVAFYGLSAGLTDSQVAALNTRVQTFASAIGAQA